jgi:hypothetical protein
LSSQDKNNIEKWADVLFAVNASNNKISLFTWSRKPETTELYYILSHFSTALERLTELNTYLNSMNTVTPHPMRLQNAFDEDNL